MCARAAELNDRELLQRFAEGDEAAFAILVEPPRRTGHGAFAGGSSSTHRMLRGCLPGHVHESLARKASKIAWEESVANWLAWRGLSHRLPDSQRESPACLARERSAKPTAVPAADPALSEVRSILDEELDRLPAKYRIPLILCCLEGKTRDEAAVELGWSAGSVKGRLERGRGIAAPPVAGCGRGLALSAVLAATLMIGASAKAVPLTLALETVRAGMAMLAGQTAGVVSSQVLILAHGALHAMLMTKFKIAAASLLILATLGIGTGYVTHRSPGQLAWRFRSFTRAVALTAGGRGLNISGAAGAGGGREARKESPTLNGIVKETDGIKNTITILTGRDDANGQTYEIVKDAKVIIREGREAKPAKFADVQPRAARSRCSRTKPRRSCNPSRFSSPARPKSAAKELANAAVAMPSSTRFQVSWKQSMPPSEPSPSRRATAGVKPRRARPMS